MEYDKIEIDFVERTLNLIKEYNGQYNATLLINCCLGLLVLPKEKHQSSIPRVEIPATGKLWGLSRKSITVGCNSCGYQLPDIIRRIRNSICHFKVRTLPDGTGEINILEIKDRGDFKVILTLDELREFTAALAEHIKS